MARKTFADPDQKWSRNGLAAGLEGGPGWTSLDAHWEIPGAAGSANFGFLPDVDAAPKVESPAS